MGLVGLGIAGREGAPEDAAHVAGLEQGEVERKPRDAGGEADDEVAALPGDGAKRRLAIVAADGIVDDVGARTADRLLELVGERFLAVAVERPARIDERLVGSSLARGLGFLFRGDGGDDAGTARLAKLDRGKADAAGRVSPALSCPRSHRAWIEVA
jgi:hypothetical protein